MTVAISKFSADKTKIDWKNGANSGADVLVDSLAHGQLPQAGGVDKTVLVVEDTIASPVVQSFYPMSGGEIAQNLHRNHLLQDTLGNVQADATARGIPLASWTQAELIELIIQDECNIVNCPYFPE